MSPMRRRAIVVGLAVLLVALSFDITVAQAPARIPRVGYISPGASSSPARLRRLEAFRQGLRGLGYVEGQSLVIESRCGAATQAAQRATTTTPIVMTVVIDPVGAGLVPNLARPGANVTGLSLIPLVGKQLQTLKEVVPKVTRVAVLANPGN